MWLYAKKRFFLIKVKHFFILIFTSYFGLGYLYDIYARRNWVSLDNFKVVNIPKKEFDRRILRELVPIKGRHQQEEPWHYVYYFERFELAHSVDMWIHVMSFVLIINFFFFLSFFSRTAHEVVYDEDNRQIFIIIFFGFCYSFDLLFGNYCFIYIGMFSFIPYYVIHFCFFWLFNFLAWFTEDPDTYTDGWLNQLFFKGSDLIESDLYDLPEMSPYDGTLHKLPNIYTIDTTFEVEKLIETRKERYQDVTEGGESYDLYHGKFWKWDWNKEILDNIDYNMTRTFRYIWYTTCQIESSFVETLYEFLNRYYKSIAFIAEVEYGFRADDYIISNSINEIEMLSWSDESRSLDKEDRSLFVCNLWLTDFPLLLRWGYLLYWFYIEYKLNKIFSKLSVPAKKSTLIFFLPSFKRFFGFKIEEKQIYKYKDGYVSFDIIPRVYLKTDINFDWELYNRPDIEYESISMQVYTLLIKIFNNSIYFILNFFGSFRFWIAVLLFWKEGSPFRTFFYWFFVFVLWKFVFIFLKFIISIPYRLYSIICFINKCFYNVFWSIYYLNIFYWSFLLNCFYWIRFVFRIILKKNRPSGSFNYFNPSPWRNYNVTKFWKKFLILFKVNIPKAFKLHQKESFSVWSRKWKKNY